MEGLSRAAAPGGAEAGLTLDSPRPCLFWHGHPWRRPSSAPALAVCIIHTEVALWGLGACMGSSPPNPPPGGVETNESKKTCVEKKWKSVTPKLGMWVKDDSLAFQCHPRKHCFVHYHFSGQQKLRVLWAWGPHHLMSSFYL